MPGLRIIMEGDNCWPDLLQLPPGKFKWDTHVGDPSLARLRGGTTGGNDSVALRLDMPEGEVIVTQFTMKLFLQAADVFRTRMEFERDKDGESTITLERVLYMVDDFGRAMRDQAKNPGSISVAEMNLQHERLHSAIREIAK